MTRHRPLLTAAICLCNLIALILSTSAIAAVIYVKQNSATDGPGSGWDNAYHTATAAVAHASAGDEIHIAFTTGTDGSFGTYHEHITLNSGISLLGGYSGSGTTRDPKTYQTILDGGLDTGGAVILIPNSTTGTILIDGLTIQRGKYININGAGINCQTTTATVTISNNIIQNCQVIGTNSFSLYGGAIYLLTPSATVTGNIIRSNSVSAKAGFWGYGGGIAFAGSGSPIISNNVIDHNTYTGSGGGIYCSGGTPNIINNTICDNTTGGAGVGGGIASANASPTVANNIIAYNSSGVSKAGSGSWTTNSNCLFSNPTVGTGNRDYEGGLAAGIGDRTSDPVFVDRTIKDYHLSFTSPCIDGGTYATGMPIIDFDGLIRPQDGEGDHINIFGDMGAYEVPVRIGQAKPNYADGSTINMGGLSVIGGFSSPNRVYLERADKNGGIRVDTSQALALGTLVNVIGTIQTDAATGERYVIPSATWPQALNLTSAIAPLDCTNLGISSGYEMLVRTTGTVTQIGPGYLYVNDGSNLNDGSKTGTVFNVGVRIVCDPTAYTAGDVLQVTGIGTSFKPSGSSQKIVLTRDASEIVKTGHVYSSLASLKKDAPLGSLAKVTGLVATTTRWEMGGSFLYAEDPSRCGGIRIVTDANIVRSPPFATVINATGTVEKNASGELQLSNATVEQAGIQSPILPLGISGKSIGGSALGNQYGVTNSIGTNTIGLLVTTWGKLTYYDSASNVFCIDDGSGSGDGSGHAGVKVYGYLQVDPGIDPTGWMLRVTGISSCEMSGTDVIRTILVRDSSEVTIIPAQ